MVEPARGASEHVVDNAADRDSELCVNGATAGLESFQDSPVPGVHQQGLFDVLAPRLDVEFLNARRIDLDGTSWIEHVPGWLTGSQHLFSELLESAPQRDRWMFSRHVTEPRITAEYPDIASAPQVLLRKVAAVLSDHYAANYRSLWINLYRHNRDSTSWHGDPIGRVQEQSVVPVLSLGSARRFLIRPAEGGKSLSFQPRSGDLIVMGGRAQRDWRHCVPKQATPAGARISVNFSTERTGIPPSTA
jgi:alkylated DNA repair dioxygenase AlkB